MNRAKDTYKEIKTITYANCIVRVHIPDISEDERSRRMKSIHDAAAALLKDCIKREAVISA